MDRTHDKDKIQACYIPSVFVTGGAAGAESIPFQFVEWLKHEGLFENFPICVKGNVQNGFSDDTRGKELIEKHGLVELECTKDSYKNMKNASMVKTKNGAVIAFIKPGKEYGRESKQTLGYVVRDVYRFPDRSFLGVDPPFPMNQKSDICCSEFGPQQRSLFTYGKSPALIVWNLNDDNWGCPAHTIRTFLDRYKPECLMVMGSTADTEPNITENGVKLLQKVFFD